MATYTQEYDAALLQVPWLSKTDSNSKPYLLKYVRHPTKPGFIVLLTDLTKVYFEPLVGIRLLARQREVEEKYGVSQRADGGSSLDIGGEEAVDEVLEQVGSLMGTELGEAEMTVAAGDLYDLDVVLRSSDCTWLFHMTEIRYGCLEIVTRHIIHPLALSTSSSRRPENTTDDQIVGLVGSKIVLDALGRHSARPPSSPIKHSKPLKSTDTARAEQSPPTEDKGGQDEAGPSRLVRRRPQDTEKPSEAKVSSPKRRPVTMSPSPAPAARSPPKTRHGKRVVQTDEDDDEMMPEEPTSSPAPRSLSPPPRKTTGRIPSKSRSPTPLDDAKEAEQEPEAEEKSSPDPPPLPPPSQKSQKEKDEEEEAELERKREEMKRKMGAGGGGRLVRRRFGR